MNSNFNSAILSQTYEYEQHLNDLPQVITVKGMNGQCKAIISIV